MAGSETERASDSVISAFLSKEGLVLSRVKDTMVADLLADLENSGLMFDKLLDNSDDKRVVLDAGPKPAEG